jgi:hypothetical protein
MGRLPLPEPGAAESEQALAERQTLEYLASDHHSAVLRRQVMGLIEACRARLPGVDAPDR